MGSAAPPSRDDIHRQMRAAAADVRCFVAVSEATGAAFEDAAVVVSLQATDDVDAALEIVRQARDWLARRGARA